MGWRDFQAAPQREFMENMESMNNAPPLIPLIPLIPIGGGAITPDARPVSAAANVAEMTRRPWISWTVMGETLPDNSVELPFFDDEPTGVMPLVLVKTATKTCYCCKGVDFWLGGTVEHPHYVCRRCHPPAPGAERMAQ
jgi:hypothetical protein